MLRFTVTELTADIGGVLSSRFEDVEIEGEVSGFKAHGSGHWYFGLKDAGASLACTMFRMDNLRMRRQPREGERLFARGSIDVFPPRGTYSLVVRELRAAGIGEAQRRLAELKRKLHAEGLFDPARKRRIPSFPTAIGVATSPTGAALQDILRVVRQRFPGMPVYVAPCRVQGDGAGAEVARAVAMLNEHGRSSVLIVGRGGGSAEDLACFNEEILVRAVAGSRIPTVSAVGHEVDVTLCDLVADLRAATPSHAAQSVTPVRAELVAVIEERRARLGHAIERRVGHARDRLRRIRLLHPRQRVARGRLRLDELEERLRAAGPRQLDVRRRRLGQAARHLDALSPLAVLVRGYAIATRDGAVIHDAAALSPGDTLRVRFAAGTADAEVKSVG